MVNLALNFNVVALIGIPLYGLIAPFKLKASDCFVLGGGLLWLGLMGTRPHKEVGTVLLSNEQLVSKAGAYQLVSSNVL